MSSSTALVPKFPEEQMTALNKVAEECGVCLSEAGMNIGGALAVAAGMQKLRQMITPQVLEAVAALQNTAVGFMTDRGSTGKTYSPEEIRDPFIEATVRGFRAVGNEFNIIAGRFYGAQQGFNRKVKTFPGLTDFMEMFDVQETSNSIAKVQAIATWNINGVPGRLERRRGKINGAEFDNRIPVRVNSGMGVDAVIGKAKRKLYAAVWDQLNNASVPTPEGDPDDLPLEGGGRPRIAAASIFDAPSANAAAEGAEESQESDQSQWIDQYRNLLAGIQAKTETGNIAREAAKDTNLSKAGRAQVMALINEATKLWPKRLAPSVASEEQHGGQEEPADETKQTETQQPAQPIGVSVEDEMLLADWMSALAGCNGILDCDKMKREELPKAPKHLQAAITQYIEARKTAIKSARGL